jgi:hypothetical protein
MSPTDKKLFQKIASWPEAEQQEIAEVAREIESRRTGIYRLSDAEREAVRQGIDAANLGITSITVTVHLIAYSSRDSAC